MIMAMRERMPLQPSAISKPKLSSTARKVVPTAKILMPMALQTTFARPVIMNCR